MAIKIGIIGGSGLENPTFFKLLKEIIVDTPYGIPSSSLKIGIIGNKEVVLISRHGKDHTITPTHVNNRANIFALKEIGCTHILSTTACGSLREKIKRGDLVILDQYIDFTKNRIQTFHDKFQPNKPIHVSCANPFSKELRELLIGSAKDLNYSYHPTGTVITIEGPRFSTKAESQMFRLFGADVINMSIAPEASLACEIDIPYATIAMSTDYDCWKEDESPVTWEEISCIFAVNVDKVINVLIKTIEKLK